MQFDSYYSRGLPKFDYNEELQAFEMTQTVSEDGDAWLFAFLDLMYVGLFSKLSQAFESSTLSRHTFEVVVAVFVIAFTSRLSLDEYSNRFFANDIFHRVLYFVYTGGVFCMVINIITFDPSLVHYIYVDGEQHMAPVEVSGLNVHGGGFLIGFVATRVSIFLLYFSICWHNRYANEQFRGVLWTAAIETVAICALYIINTNDSFVQDGSVVGIYFLFVIMEAGYSALVVFLLHLDRTGRLVLPTTSCASEGMEEAARACCCLCVTNQGDKSAKFSWRDVLVVKLYYPADVYLSQTRLGAFIMMVLGEAVISVIIPSFGSNQRDCFFAFATLGIVFMYGLQYYDSVVRLKGRGVHAMTRSLLSSYLFTWLHAILGICMFLSSVALGLVYSSADAEKGDGLLDLPPENSGGAAVLLGWSVGLSIAVMEALRTLHYGLKSVFYKRRKLATKMIKIVFILLHIVAPFYASNAFWSVLTHCVLLAIMNVGDIWISLAHRKQVRDHLDKVEEDGRTLQQESGGGVPEFDADDLPDDMRARLMTHQARVLAFSTAAAAAQDQQLGGGGVRTRKSRSSSITPVDFSVSSLHSRPSEAHPLDGAQSLRPISLGYQHHQFQHQQHQGKHQSLQRPQSVKQQRHTRRVSSPYNPDGDVESGQYANLLQVDATFAISLANMKRHHASALSSTSGASSGPGSASGESDIEDQLDTPWTNRESLAPGERTSVGAAAAAATAAATVSTTRQSTTGRGSAAGSMVELTQPAFDTIPEE